MEYYPVCLRIEGKPCLVVGGGRVASRKAAGLLAAGAVVTVVSPELSSSLDALRRRGAVVWEERGYRPGDAAGFFLVMAATDDEGVQRMVYEDAERLNILVNVADVPQRCNFILPALVRRGPLSIAVSTSGNSPALAKKLRRELEKRFGREYEILCSLMGDLRPWVLGRGLEQEDNEDAFNRMLAGDTLSLIAAGDSVGLRRRVEEAVGREMPADLAERLRARLAAFR